MKSDFRSYGQLMRSWIVMFVVPLIFLTGCDIGAEATLKTGLHSMGGGTHEMIVTVPEGYYSGDVFDQLPDFSLITGVTVSDYHDAGQRGMQIQQSFFNLRALSRNEHFLNQSFPGDPLAFQAEWKP